MKTTLLVGASALAFILATPGAALADGECGNPDISSDPNIVSCVSDPGRYPAGITYNQASYATPAGLRLDLYGTLIVTATSNPIAVRAIGRVDHSAIITARTGSRFSATDTGLSATTTGAGLASIDSHGTVSAGLTGLIATADLTGGAGLASVLNQSDGTVTLTQTNVTGASYGIFARGGSASATNNGTITATSATAGAGTIYGIAGETHAVGGTMTLVNTNAVTLGGATNLVGMASTGSTGAVSISNTGTIAANSLAGSATGFLVAAGGTAGAVTATNNGTLTVRATSAAIGMDVEQGSSVTLVAQRTGATGGMSVTGGSATGFLVNNATDAVSVQNTGFVQQVAAATGAATGVTITGGTSQSVRFADSVLGGTAYKADLIVTGPGAGQGVALAGATGAVSVNFNGAALSVTSTGTSASGITVSGGADVAIGTTANATTGNGAAITVTAAGGAASGVRVAQATGAESVTLRDAFAVTNSAGSATGLSLQDGATQTVSLAQGAHVTGVGATGASMTGASGAVSFTSAAAFSVDGGAGGATGLTAADGTAQTLQLGAAFSVSASGGVATGANLLGGQSAALTFASDVAVGNGAGDAIGVASSGPAATVQFAKGATVSAAGGAATGIQATGGTTITTAGAIAVTASGVAQGVDFDGATGMTTLHLPTALTVSSTSADAFGLVGRTGTGLTVDGAGTIDVRASGNAAGIYTTTQSGAQTIVVDTVTAQSNNQAASGIVLGSSVGIQLSANSVTATGVTGGAGVDLLGIGADVQAAMNGVSTTGNGAVGVSASASGSGNVALTVGRASIRGQATAQAVTINGVSTTGADSTGVRLSVVDGAGTLVNNGVIATTGTNATGIAATAGGAGALSVRSATVTAAGAGAQAINATSNTGAITVAAANSSSIGADAIHLTSTSGAVTVTLADGGATRSGAGAGLWVDTGGTATINLGTDATTATLQGTTVGLSSRAAGGQTVTLSGVVSADAGPAVNLAGGAAALINRGTINGAINATSSSLAFSNAGTWNATGSASFGGAAVLTNSGTINIAAGAGAAGTTRFTGLTSVRNGGTISLANGRVGDVLDLGGASFVGTAGSRVVLDANLSGVAVNGAAAQSADMLRVGAASGTTTLVVNDVSGATGAQFNFAGVRLVNAASATANAFVLDGGSINKGFAQYQLLVDAAGNLNLVGLPTSQAFALVRTGAETRRYWRRSGDAWSEQMRASAPNTGLSVWGQLHGGEETNRARPVYTETVLDTPTSFTPNLDVRDSWTGGQLGFDWGQGNWSVGVTGGYLSQQGRLTATGDQLKLDGGNLGIYLRYRVADGFFAHVLGKADRYALKYQLTGGAAAPKVNGTSYGVQLEAGYHLRAGAMFVEPSASISASKADIDGVQGAAGGLSATFDNGDGAYGRAGLRAGVETASGAWSLQPYVGAAWEGELAGRPGATLTSGGTSLRFADENERARARLEAGVTGNSSRGLSAFVKVEAVTGAKAKGLGGRAGVALRW